MDNQPDIQAAITRVMYQPSGYLHSSRRFSDLPQDDSLHGKVTNAAILNRYQLPLNIDFDAGSQHAMLLLLNWTQLPRVCDYLGKLIRYHYGLPDDSPPDNTQRAFLSLCPVLSLPDWPAAQTFTDDNNIADPGITAMTQLMHQFSPALSARLPLMFDTQLSFMDKNTIPALPYSLFQLVFLYVPFTS
ncbi:hypothetical protein L9H26_11650 [Morganella psychrotolerans]|uniref:Type III secretion apparatus protein OrgA/MxiK n=1 Tax=Morganella psychrotolerans TaxID=368603 RepID=A0A5M9R7K8_9GAMM|nr:hypothetical protein [Morganella psychrotolerans]KAA8715415.1 hypothetical protein F4V73_10585 [Morganella psychrotolerans]OBU05463.1 hypothetical protein AYY16_09385 [Morganella psychrotolerans]